MSDGRGISEGLLSGRNPVREALEREDARIEKVLVQRGLRSAPIEAIAAAARQQGIPVQYVPAGRLSQLAGGATHQGVVAISAPVEYLQLEEMLNSVAASIEDVRRDRPIIVVLDEIQDPHNYGAILRSAVGVGASGVVVPERNMAPLSATAVKASAGMALRIPIARAGNLSQALVQMKERGYWVAGAAADAYETIWSADWDRALALVIGSEGGGLRPSIRDKCDFLVSIPMRGPAESLNASVAAGILFFAAARTRGLSNSDRRS